MVRDRIGYIIKLTIYIWVFLFAPKFSFEFTLVRQYWSHTENHNNLNYEYIIVGLGITKASVSV